MSRISSLAIAAILCGLPATGMGQSFPERPIRLILGVAPGGGQDTVARAMSAKLVGTLGTNLIVDNRAGGGGVIAVNVAKQASPDGYTLLMISSSNVIQPIVYDSAYNVARDFSPVAQLVTQPYLLSVPASLSVKSVSELITYSKANPDKTTFGSAGSGSLTHLAAELFKDRAQINALHVPYKGTGAVYPDLIAGRLQFAFVTIVSAQGHVRAGRLRALAVSSTQRAKAIPELPTISESGLTGYAVTQWYAVLAPLSTTRPIISRLNKAFVDAIVDPELAAHLAADGAEASPSTPEQLAAHLKAEQARWTRTVERSGLRNVK
jgi:tripartite-type tricarboxylate transporter receptor subunit TctC